MTIFAWVLCHRTFNKFLRCYLLLGHRVIKNQVQQFFAIVGKIGNTGRQILRATSDKCPYQVEDFLWRDIKSRIMSFEGILKRLLST